MTTSTSATSFSTSFSVDASPEAAFAAINDPRAWWSAGIEGPTAHPGDEFDFEVEGIHRSHIRVTEVVPYTKVVWLVLDTHITFVEDPTEWIGNEIVFEVDAGEGQTTIRFTQNGLVPDYECYDACSNAWRGYVNESLASLIATGHGAPIPKD